MLQTLERTNTFDARILTASHAGALRELTGDTGLPLLPCLHPALEEGQIVGDYAGQGELQAAAALLPLYADDPLPTSLRAKEDYLMGINFSRVLTLRYGNSVSNYLNTKHQAISVGRVMTCVRSISPLG